jgi:hypothetical protein
MKRLRKAFSLLEVLITAAVLVTAIVFIFQAFTISLNAAKFSQDITLGCLLAEGKFWEIEQRNKDKIPQADYFEGEITMHNKKFAYKYTITDTDITGLKQLQFNVSWEEKRKTPYSMGFLTYLFTQPQ